MTNLTNNSLNPTGPKHSTECKRTNHPRHCGCGCHDQTGDFAPTPPSGGAELEDLRGWLAGSFQSFLEANATAITATSPKIAADYAIARFQAYATQYAAREAAKAREEAYERGQTDAIKKYVNLNRKEGERNGVTWTIGVIDDLHLKAPMMGGDLDREYKGIKNTIRDRYKAAMGVDPAPHYPVNAQLANQQPEHKESK